MIRLNAFFEVNDGVDLKQVKALADEMVEKSRKDEGNMGYDLHVSSTNPSAYMFCETWENDELLDKHSNSEHFTRIVPALGKLCKVEMKIERFDK